MCKWRTSRKSNRRLRKLRPFEIPTVGYVSIVFPLRFLFTFFVTFCFFLIHVLTYCDFCPYNGTLRAISQLGGYRTQSNGSTWDRFPENKKLIATVIIFYFPFFHRSRTSSKFTVNLIRNYFLDTSLEFSLVEFRTIRPFGKPEPLEDW